MSRHGGGGGGRGERGHPGHNGRDGRDGNDGPIGPQGPQGEKGCAGDGGAVFTLEVGKRILLPRGGKIRKLFVHSDIPLAIGQADIFPRLNGEAGELVASLKTGEQKASDKKHYLRANEGDILDVLILGPIGLTLLISVILE